MENNEVIEVPVEELELEIETVDEGETLENGVETQDVTSLLSGEMVSGGDSVSNGEESAAETIINQITIDGAEVHVIQEYTLLGEYAKPLDAYSVSEGLLLCIFLVLLGQAISKIIGGVLNCKLLFKK